jgi:hypothetical protein
VLRRVRTSFTLRILPLVNRDSSVNKGTGYGPDDRLCIPGRVRNLSFCHHVQTGPGARPAFCPALSSGIKQPERGAVHSSLSNFEVNVWSFMLTPYPSSWRGAEAQG